MKILSVKDSCLENRKNLLINVFRGIKLCLFK